MKYTTEEIIHKFKEKHGDTYDYSKVVYSGIMKKVTIVCRKHGDFFQAPNTHLTGANGGRGCGKCAIEARANSRRGSSEEFLKRAKEVHGDKFDYSKSEYKLSTISLTVTCKVHGDFKVTPSNHLAGKDCWKCSCEKKHAAKRSNTSEFLEKLKKVFDNKYDYSKVVYGRNNEEKVEIICKLHGSFFSKPANLLQGKGCPSCSSQGFVPSNPTWIYILESSSGIIKIGISFDAKRRHEHICKDSGIDFKLVSKFYIEDGRIAYEVEQKVLKILRNKYEQLQNNFSGSTECFYDVSAIEVERLVTNQLSNCQRAN